MGNAQWDCLHRIIFNLVDMDMIDLFTSNVLLHMVSNQQVSIIIHKM